ncbi:Uncharacterised protein [Shigella sonnei]|nr:Uncharacterised protein [Shigella sonnei]
MFCHQHYVAFALAQWWQLYNIKSQSVEQVSAKSAFIDHRREIGIRRAYQPHIHLQWLAAANALQFTVLNHAQ